MKNALKKTILLFSIFLLFIVACSPLKKYKTSVLGWEKDIEKFEHLDSIETYSPNSVLFLGSSSIRLWNTIKEDMAPFETIQRGFGGAKLSDIAWYTPRIAYPHPCKAIVLFVANDITGADEDKSPQEVLKLFKYIVKTLRVKFPETPIFYIQVTPTESRWKVWPQIQQGNQLINANCKYLHRVYFIETEAQFLNMEGKPNPALFVKDKLHLSREGYLLWADIIKRNLQQVLK